jgi:formylglycine-generating enzyme required for sulfatase activity
MGSPASEPGRRVDEGPQHRVTFARAFAVGVFAVTREEWRACVAEGACAGSVAAELAWRHPVDNVTWAQAKQYVAWLSSKTGHIYRLLSEAEREYVTRAGTTTPYWFGSGITKADANYEQRFSASFSSLFGTVDVQTFQPNPWGLYQVHGNVYEWVEDCWNSSYRGAPTDGSAWTSGECWFRVARGGNFASSAEFLRSASRDKGAADDSVIPYPVGSDKRGLRVARTLRQ